MNQCFYPDDVTGEFYQCATLTAAGESPASTPAKWKLVRIPAAFRPILAQLTFAELLDLDGQGDKAAAARAYGANKLDQLVRTLANKEEHREQHNLLAGQVAAGVVIDDACRRIGWDRAQMDDREKADVRNCFSMALQTVWEAWWWADLMLCQQYEFAPTCPNPNPDEPFEHGDIRYWPLTDKYYYQLRGDYISTPTDANGVLNTNAWVELKEDSRPAVWDPTKAYVAGDQVSWLNVLYVALGTPAVGDTPPGTAWLVYEDFTPALPYDGGDAGLIGPRGPVRLVSRYDPRRHEAPHPIPFVPATFVPASSANNAAINGILVHHRCGVARPWVWSRRVTPIITGDAFDPAATYTATDPGQLVYP